jgi:prepilin signal peptidase PulO-like enzyme (type II secretory pathway)
MTAATVAFTAVTFTTMAATAVATMAFTAVTFTAVTFTTMAAATVASAAVAFTAVTFTTMAFTTMPATAVATMAAAAVATTMAATTVAATTVASAAVAAAIAVVTLISSIRSAETGLSGIFTLRRESADVADRAGTWELATELAERVRSARGQSRFASCRSRRPVFGGGESLALCGTAGHEHRDAAKGGNGC